MAKKNAVGPKGARLLRKVAKHILAEPLRYEQNMVVSRGNPGEEAPGSRRVFPACGTIACIGGWLQIMTMPNTVTDHEFCLPFYDLSAKLGVTHDQFSRLTNYTTTPEPETAWPKQFRSAYNKAKTPRQKAQIANERIEHFIRTGE